MKFWLTILLFQFAMLAYAQPSNDECETAIDLGIVPFCEPTIFSNLGATASDIGPGNVPSCWENGTVQRDVWFKFTASDKILDYTITLKGEGATPITNPQLAIYRGDCGPGTLFFYGCFKPQITGAQLLKFNLSGLTPGADYWIRISDWPENPGTNAGSFSLCIEKKSPLTNIIEGFSKECEGLLVDSGGPDGDYGPNETYVFTICPEVPSTCIELNFIYYNIEYEGDQITIYDGPNTTSPVIGTIISSFVQGPSFQTNWGGVCKQFNASSGCITVQFTSNATEQYDGFLAEWKCLPTPCKTLSQPTFQTFFSNEEVIQNLSSTQAVVKFDKLNCAEGASGLFFNGDNTDLGLGKGVILTTGLVSNANGPNNSGSMGTSASTPGDTDLDILSSLSGNALQSYDACILELDVYANTDELSFEYVFGSEEYAEFVGSNFNDIFAFLISGPGVNGIPQIGYQANMAVLPNGDPVEINSVNTSKNWEYFRLNNNGISLQYDGLTSDYLAKKKSLTARYSVTPCQTYHLKLAIADRGDTAYDSGVFISEIKGGAPSVAVSFKNGIDYLVEDCTNLEDEVIISLNSPLDKPVTYNVTITGTATQGVDYTLNIPSTITFQAGEILKSFPIIPLSDNISEGDETIIITLSNDFGCGSVVFATYEIIIRDELKIIVNSGVDTALLCENSTLVLSAEGAGSYFWEPVNVFSDPNANPTAATPVTDQWVFVTGQLGVCVAKDSIYLQHVVPQIDITNGSSITVCEGTPVELFAQNNLNGQGTITWTPTFGLSPTTGEKVIAKPTFSITYQVTGELTGCTATDQIDVNIIDFNFPQVLPNVDICEGSSIKLASTINFSNTTYVWTPATGLDNPNISGPIATPLETTTYKLVASSVGEVCKDSAEVTLTVLPAAVSVLEPDTVYLCLGDTISLSASFTPGGTLYWTPKDSSSLIQVGDNAWVTGASSFMAYATVDVGPCKRTDSVFVRIDSLPDLSIGILPAKPIYCEGEVLLLYSQNYLNKDYPDIDHTWTPNNGSFMTPDSNLNLVIRASSSTTYIRYTDNNACSSLDSLSITVIPAGILLSDNQIKLCEGETKEVEILDENIENIEWSPTQGLSCSDCKKPTITGTTTMVYTIKGEDQGCGKAGAVVVNVPIPVLNLQPNITICRSDSIHLNSGGGLPTTYVWTSTDPTFGTSTSANPYVSPMSQATYYVTATFDGCVKTGQVTISVTDSPPLVLQKDTAICAGQSVALNLMPGQGVNYTWTSTDPNFGGSTNANPVVTPGQNATYTVIANAGPCSLSGQINITVNSLPVLNITPNITICSGQVIPLNPNGNPAYSHVWTSTDPAFGTNTSINPAVSPGQNATYTVVATENSCTATATTTVNVIQQPTLSLVASDLSICEGESITLTATASPPGGTFSWAHNPSLTSAVIIETPTASSTVYTVTYTTELQCFEKSISIVVNTFSPAGASYTYNVHKDSFIVGLPIIFTAILDNPPGPPGLIYIWKINGQVVQGATGPVLETIITEPPFEVTLTTQTIQGCDFTIDSTFLSKLPQVQIPNVFTPNKDNTNDAFRPIMDTGLELTSFKVYNRWGNLVFDKADAINGWDGTRNGEALPSDVYAYVMTFQYGTGRSFVMRGDVTLIR